MLRSPTRWCWCGGRFDRGGGQSAGTGDLLKRLSECKAVPGRLNATDIYFRSPVWDFKATGRGFAHTHQGFGAYLTYKGPRLIHRPRPGRRSRYRWQMQRRSRRS